VLPRCSRTMNDWSLMRRFGVSKKRASTDKLCLFESRLAFEQAGIQFDEDDMGNFSARMTKKKKR
jgi:hypothetical protein